MKKKIVRKKEKIVARLIWTVVVGIVWLLASVLLVLALWYLNTFSMGFEELLYTILSPLGGTGQSTVSQILDACLMPVITLMLVYVGFVVGLWHRGKCYKVLRRIGAVLCVVALLSSSCFAVYAFGIDDYLKKPTEETGDIYEQYYVHPLSVDITDVDGKPKNLIYIYLESMETTYASAEVGGEQAEINYIPNLTALAEEYISFSDSTGLGGFHSVAGTSWTMGALLSTTSGIPFSLAVYGEKAHNSVGKNGNFANRLTALGDVLEILGYRQEFLCGSDIAFAGRDSYFTQHGSYELFDYYTAIEEGYIDEDYKVWWGYEDEILYEIAKDEVLELAAGDQPFNFTMLTVDTHHVGGYACNLCGETYDTNLENVVSCADAQVAAFIKWCQEQDFYEDTVIVVTGDHPRMDTQLVKGVDFYDRTIYNCFINCEAKPVSVENRIFTSMDLFPTVLAAMGYSIGGERLGLGTNIFSDVPTLAEQYGYDWLEEEISKYSEYYEEHFS
ncbi:MAG: LTA synthase family protein [Clostridia bacterium]|nr:LTA synthase family protein [Clostridia bacterium]